MTKSIQIYLTLSFILILSGCGQSDERVQDELLQIETSSFEITWELVSNIQEEGAFQAIIHLQNNSENLLPASGWALYFNSIRMLVPESFPDQFRVSHINGDFFKLEPTNLFRPLEPGESLSIPYSGHHFKIKKGDAPQGFYFVFDNQRIENVEEIEVLPFISDEQTKRSPDDQLGVPTAESEFHRNDVLTQLEYSQINKITPTPVSIHEGVGVFQFSGEIPVVHHALFIAEAEYLSDYLMQSFGMISNTVLLPNESDDPVIVLDQIYDRLDSDEAYRMDVTPEQITISANDSKGVFYGIQSLKALIENRESEELQIQSVHIEDTPAFPYRGMHLDVARNFQSVNDVKQLLDLMAMYKMNRFHFHLTDDEGWRLAIDPLPELVQIGGRRGHTEIESAYLIPSYGSGPDPRPGSSFGSGWYSRDQYIDILRYAAERHIEVIPEIDVPGHARAAIIAMEARTERLLGEGNDEEANLYRLVEEGDESEYLSIQNFNDNVINVCIESTYRFLDLVIDELVLMHEMADAPLHKVHVGGDEVPVGAWERSPACASVMEEEGLDDVRELQSIFFDRLNQNLLNRGLKMAGWEEVVFMEDPEDGSHVPNPQFTENVSPHVWSNIWGSGTEHYTYELANMGYRVVMSHASTFYLDMTYNKDWEEPGFYWASMFTTKEPYSFIPFDLYKNAVEDNYGNPIPENRYDDAIPLLDSAKENLLGIQAQLWTETVNREGRMDYMIFPRLLGVAERAWVGDADWSLSFDKSEMFANRDIAWNEFANRLGHFELKRLDQRYGGVGYRIPPPGAIILERTLHANSDFPGLQIRYTTDGSIPDEDSPIYDGPVDVSGPEIIHLSTFNSIGRSSRTVQLNQNM